MAKQVPKLNPDWVREARDYFKQFLKVTKFPHPRRNGGRGSEFEYPEWMIMFIAVLSVKCQVKSYLKIHELSTQYWDILAEGTNLKSISETAPGSLKKDLPLASKTCSIHFSSISSRKPRVRKSAQTR